MAYKFEKLDVWQRSLEYADLVYGIAGELPPDEKYNLKSQITRAANSIALNIAEGSTGLSDKEQVRFIEIASRSLVETVACIHLIRRRGYFEDLEPLREAYRFSETLFAQLQAFRSSLDGQRSHVQERQLPTMFNPLLSRSNRGLPSAVRGPHGAQHNIFLSFSPF